MSELSDLVGVLGAVDDYVVDRPDLIPEVGKLLCPYRYGAAGWFPELRDWLASRPTPDDTPPLEIPTLDEALRGLSDLDDDETEPQDPGLRLLTLAVLGRVMDGYGAGGENQDHTLRALAVPGLAAGDPGRAEALLRLLTDTERFPDSGKWDEMMGVAVSDMLISPAAAQPLRCQGEVVEVSVAGHPQPATAITTTLIADDLTFDDATAFLDPAEWPHCCRAWCAMTRAQDASDGTHRYEEVIGLACPTPLLTTCLGFRKVATTDLAVVAYRLSPPTAPDCHSDGEVLVDEGSIEVRDRAPAAGVSVTTTKRVMFKSLPSGPLAMFSCISGYGDMGQLLIYQCAQRHAAAGTAGKAKKATKGAKTKKKLKTDPPPTGGGGSDSGEVINEIATLAKGCVTDGAASYRARLKKVIAGTYTTNDAASDVGTVWKRTAHDVAKIVDVGFRAVKIAGRDPEPPPEPEQKDDE